jgi:hypothetical protein
MTRIVLVLSGFLIFAAAFVLGSLVGSATGSPSDINIHNIQKSFDPVACEVTISWDTDECTTTNTVHWDTASCQQSPSFPYSAGGGGAGRSHTAILDVTGTGNKISFYIESSNACDTQTTDCMPATSGPCAMQ